jgi:hypothetical protein
MDMKVKLLATRSRKRAFAVVTAVIAVATVGAAVAADSGEGAGPQPQAAPGTPVTGEAAVATESPLPIEDITTGGTNFDPTILTKFIPGRSFVPHKGLANTVNDDTINYSGNTCISALADPGMGSFIDVYAAVELPDGARIKRVTFFGTDNAATDISITLNRVQYSIPQLLGVTTRSDVAVTSFSTAGFAGESVVSSADNLDEITGSFSPSIVSSSHRFHSLDVVMHTAAGNQEILCGIEVQFQVPESGADPGTVFHPITPVRAYDSRITAYPVNGPIPNNSSRVVDISAGHDLATGAVTLADAVPVGATAITYNLTSDASTTVGFVAITPGNAATFATSALNLNGTPLANGGTVAIAGDRTVKVFVGGGGSTQIIIDVTGFYTGPVPFPNMAG